MQPSGDTIAAIATPPGRGGIGVVRVSGPLARRISTAIQDRHLVDRMATFTRFLDGNRAVIDTGLALFFESPRSFTGQDVLELQGHGGPAVTRLLLERVCQLGARPAEAGEFTLRAFLNNRIDLLQAEAVADLIDAGSGSAARSAARSLTGEFSSLVERLVDELVALRTFIEAAIDFPDEEIDHLADSDVGVRLAALETSSLAILESAERGAVLRDGVTAAIVGAPNVGKSSLLNRLTRLEAAIVTDVPGTTRDAIRESVVIGGVPVHLIDTAGVRDTVDEVEKAGIERTYAALETADIVMLVTDARSGIDESLIASKAPGASLILVRNKADLTVDPTGWRSEGEARAVVTMSALRDPDLGALEEALDHLLLGGPVDHLFTARARHLAGLARATEALSDARRRFERDRAGELVAEDLRVAQQALESLTGRFTTEDLLDRIFSSFCIGK